MKQAALEKPKDNHLLIHALTTVLLLAIAVLVLCVVLLLSGNNPILVLQALAVGAFGSPAKIINVLNKTVPICFAGLSVGLARQGGIFNIGVEGQLVFGALGSTIVGIYFTGLPAWLHIPLSFLGGMLFGAVFALLPTAMFLKWRVNLLVVFILLNNIASKLITYFVIVVIGDPTAMTTSSLPIQESAYLPNFLTSPGRLNIGIFVMLALCAILYFFYYKTTAGFQMKAVGLNRTAAAYSGLSVNRYLFLVLVLGGAIAGLAGSVEVMGTYHRLYDGFSPGYGFDGIPIALLANGNPIGIIIGSILFAALRVGSLSVQLEMGVSSEIVSVIQGILIVLIACEYILKYAATKLASRKKG